MKKKAINKYMIILFAAIFVVMVFVLVKKTGKISTDNDNETIISSSEETSLHNSHEFETNNDEFLNEEKNCLYDVVDKKVYANNECIGLTIPQHSLYKELLKP